MEERERVMTHRQAHLLASSLASHRVSLTEVQQKAWLTIAEATVRGVQCFWGATRERKPLQGTETHISLFNMNLFTLTLKPSCLCSQKGHVACFLGNNAKSGPPKLLVGGDLLVGKGVPKRAILGHKRLRLFLGQGIPSG